MGWLSRTFRPAAPSADPGETSSPAGPPPVPPVPGTTTGRTPAAAPEAAAPPVPAMPTSGASSPTGRYGPLVCVTHFDAAPPELEWQLPLNGELYRLMPGSDRPDYSLFVLERPLHFYPAVGFDLGRVDAGQRVEDRKGRTMVRVHAMLLCSRFVGQQLHPGMKDLAVNLAYVIDNSLARDPEVDFGKIEFAATGFLSEGHAVRSGDEAPVDVAAGAPTDTRPDTAPDAMPDSAPDAAPDSPYATTPWATAEPAVGEAPAADQPHDAEGERPASSAPSDLLDEVARTLRHGVEAQRGARVERLTAVLTLDPAHRLTGLSGNADGQAPVPTPETFDRLAELLGRLSSLGDEGRLTAVTVRVDGDDVSHEVARGPG